jgi:hypothetical protein
LILSSILPGVRQLRAPLAAGYLWILFVFLVAHLGSHRPHTDLADDLTRLAGAVSPAGLAVGVSFAAYLLGAFSQGLSRGLWLGLARMFAPVDGFRLSPRGYESLDDLLTPRAMAGEIGTAAEARTLENEMVGELTLIKTRLLEVKQDLHNEIDRLHAEADFLGAVLIPLIALGVVGVLAIPVGPIGPILSVHFVKDMLIYGLAWLALVFGMQAVKTNQQANDKLIDAIFLGQVRSPALDRWDREASVSV